MYKCLENYKKYGADPTTHDILKYIALATMLVDHFGLFVFDNDLTFRAIGRWSFPIWLFLAGYAKSGKFDKELVVLATLIVVANYLVHQPIFSVNILFSIMAARLYINFMAGKKYDGKQIYVYWLVLLVWLPVSMLVFEYGTLAFMFALCGYMRKNYPEDKNTLFIFVATAILYIVTQCYLEDFNYTQKAMVAFGVAFIMCSLYSFKLEIIKEYRYKTAHKVGMFLARNSLYVYFLHFVLLLVVSEYF